MPARPPLRSLLSGALSLLLLALIVAVRAHLAPAGELTDPIAYAGTTEETLDAGRFRMEVQEVAFSHGISDEDISAMETDDLWLTVTATLTATTEDVKVMRPVLLENGDGRSYAASPLATWSMGGAGMEETWLEPEIPVTAMAVFEISPDRLSEPELSVTVATTRYLDRLSSTAVVDLGLDAEELRRGIAEAADDVAVPKPERGDPGGGATNDGDADD